MNTLSKTALIRLRMGRIPRSASVCARGHRGKAGHAMEVMFKRSTSFGSYRHETQTFSWQKKSTLSTWIADYKGKLCNFKFSIREKRSLYREDY
jgi:hypothetical protein